MGSEEKRGQASPEGAHRGADARGEGRSREIPLNGKKRISATLPQRQPSRLSNGYDSHTASLSRVPIADTTSKFAALSVVVAAVLIGTTGMVRAAVKNATGIFDAIGGDTLVIVTARIRIFALALIPT